MNTGNKNRPKTYKDLEIWKKSFLTSKELLRFVNKLPHTTEIKIVLNQLLRAVMSVGANIAEGYGRYNSKEYVRFLRISLGSANEADYWLSLLLEICPDQKHGIAIIIDANTEVIRMLSSSIKTIGRKN